MESSSDGRDSGQEDITLGNLNCHAAEARVVPGIGRISIYQVVEFGPQATALHIPWKN